MKYRLSQIRIWYDKITKSDDLNDLVNKLNIDRNQLVLLSMSRSYHVFTIPKKDGSFRLIEDPQKNLKELQREFNKYLQAVYYLHQTEAAFGFIIHVKEGKYRKDILNNARRHLGHRYMLKIDLEDFFHQVGIKRVARILQSKPFIFRREPARTLARLFTYKQRLPMGAPTSPVLSNFATMGLDPYSGFMHTDFYRKPSLVFDLIEPVRPIIDKIWTGLITNGKISDRHFVIKEQGWWLNKAGKRIIIPEFNRYLYQRVKLGSQYYSLKSYIYNLSNDLGNLIKKTVQSRQ